MVSTSENYLLGAEATYAPNILHSILDIHFFLYEIKQKREKNILIDNIAFYPILPC